MEGYRRSPARAGSSAVAALMTIMLLAASAAPAWSSREPCNVSNTADFEFGDYAYVPIDLALECFNAITLPYHLAHQQVTALSAFYEEFYVFNDIVANPAGTPHSEALTVPGLQIYSEKVDIQASLKALAASFRKNAPVPLAKLLFGVNSIVQPLRDGHLSTGMTGAFGGVLGDGSWWASFLLMDYDESTGNVRTVRIQVKGVHGKAVVTDRVTNRIIKSIGGKRPMTWLKDMASTGPFSSMAYKSPGVRMNKLLSTLQTGGSWIVAQDISSLEPMPTAGWLVHYTDGSRSSWVPYVSVQSQLYSQLSVAQLSSMASQPATPYLALQNALNHSGYTPVPAAAPQSRELHERSLAAAAAAGLPDNLIIANSQVIGNYYIDTDASGKKFAVWKLTTFNRVPVATYAEAWNRLVAWAEGNGTDRLVYDVVSNGGGDLIAGAWAFAALFPEVLQPDNTYPWLNSNDRRVGPAAKYLVENDLLLDGIAAGIQALTSNHTWMEERAAELSVKGSTELAEILLATERILESVNILIANNTQAVSCNQGRTICAAVWNIVYPSLMATIAQIPRSSTSVEALNNTLHGLFNLLQVFTPFSETASTSMDGRNKSFLYSANTKLHRGKTIGEYTQRFYVTTTASFASLPPVAKSPFKQVLAVTDGACGSTCDTFTRSAWFYSANNPDAASFKYFGFGGTGFQQDMTATSFPGGNVASTDYLSMAWAYYGVAYVTAYWTGIPDVIDSVDEIGSVLPGIPPYTGTRGLPAFTQSEVYQTTLGPHALPMEFNLIPPDLYGKQWFIAMGAPTQGNNWKGGADLPALYKLAAKYFDD